MMPATRLAAGALRGRCSVRRCLVWWEGLIQTPRPRPGIKKFWAAAIRKANIPDYRRHDNRHTYASHLVSDGLSLEVVGRLLGHTSPSTTKRYAHLADDPRRAATERFASKFGTYSA